MAAQRDEGIVLSPNLEVQPRKNCVVVHEGVAQGCVENVCVQLPLDSRDGDSPEDISGAVGGQSAAFEGTTNLTDVQVREGVQRHVFREETRTGEDHVLWHIPLGEDVLHWGADESYDLEGICGEIRGESVTAATSSGDRGPGAPKVRDVGQIYVILEKLIVETSYFAS